MYYLWRGSVVQCLRVRMGFASEPSLVLAVCVSACRSLDVSELQAVHLQDEVEVNIEPNLLQWKNLLDPTQ